MDRLLWWKAQPCIRMVGAFDCHNYGDLLFPLVTKALLSTLTSRYQFAPYGVQRNDLSRFGAMPCRAMKDLYGDVNRGDIVLVAGGEILAQTWLVMHMASLLPDQARMLDAHARKVGNEAAELYSRQVLGAKQIYPFVFRTRDFRRKVRILYNSVGGWPLRDYPKSNLEQIVSRLAEAPFVSMRDEVSSCLVSKSYGKRLGTVAPDIVFLLSEVYPKDRLRRLASEGVRDLVQRAGEFVCFQCHTRVGEANRGEIARQLRELRAKTGLQLVLVPIGRFHSFEDDVFLESLSAEIGGNVELLPKTATLSDTAFTLASSSLFVGTSLHGVVTALTYGIPFVGLVTEDPKLRNNINTWAMAKDFDTVSCTDIAQAAVSRLALPKHTVECHSDRLRRLARANVEALAHAIEA